MGNDNKYSKSREQIGFVGIERNRMYIEQGSIIYKHFCTENVFKVQLQMQFHRRNYAHTNENLFDCVCLIECSPYYISLFPCSFE